MRGKLQNCAGFVRVYKTCTFSLGVSGMLVTKEGEKRMCFFAMCDLKAWQAES